MSADKKITELSPLTTPELTDLVPIVNGGATKKVTVDNLTKHKQDLLHFDEAIGSYLIAN